MQSEDIVCRSADDYVIELVKSHALRMNMNKGVSVSVRYTKCKRALV